MVNVENHQYLRGNCKLLSVIWVKWKQSVCFITLPCSSTFYSLFIPLFVLKIFKFKYGIYRHQTFCFHFQIWMIWTAMLDPKIGPKIWLFFFRNIVCNIMLILKINVTLALFLIFSCYFMKSMCIKMKEFRVFEQNLSICLSYNTIISK